MLSENLDGETTKGFIAIPYVKNISEHFRTLATKTGYRLTFVGCNKFNNIIKGHKDILPKQSNSNVVYRINCRDCEASYVEQTSRLLSTRIKEHKKINYSNPSVVHEHRIQFDHEFGWKNVFILGKEPFYIRRLVSEMVHIKQQRNGINLQSDKNLFDNNYTSIIDKLKRS